MVSKFKKITLFSNREIIAEKKQIDKKNKSVIYLSLYPRTFHHSTNKQSKMLNQHRSNFTHNSAAATYAFIYSQISSPVEASITQWRKVLETRHKPNVSKASFQLKPYLLRNSDNAISKLAVTINPIPEITIPEENKYGYPLLGNPRIAETMIIKNIHEEEQQKKIEFLMREIYRLHAKIITIKNKLIELNQEETALQEIKKELIGGTTEFATQFTKSLEKNIEPQNAYTNYSQKIKYLINIEEKLKNKAYILADKINNKKLKALSLETRLKNQSPALKEINDAIQTIKTEISKNANTLKNISIVLSLLSDNLHKLFIAKKPKAVDKFNQLQDTTTSDLNNITNNVVFMPNRIKK